MEAIKTKLIDIDLLHLDLENPRFGLFSASSEPEALQVLVDKENIKELWGSISARGFEGYEPLIALRHPELPGHFVIIEGNRRLAACQSLLDPSLLTDRQRAKLPAISAAVRETMLTLPVAVVETRADAAAYIGFKHVNGPSTWSSLAKAKFGVEMLEASDPEMSREQQMMRLTQELGDSRGMLLRIFVAFKIFAQAIQLNIVGDEEGMLPKEIEFSHLYTMLNNPDTRVFLGLRKNALTEDDVIDDPIPESHHSELKELLHWLFGEKRVIKSQGQDRPKLQKVLANSEGLEALRASGDLTFAYAAAGLQNEDWLADLYKCAALAKRVENDALEMASRIGLEDLASALKQTQIASRNMSSLTIKLRTLGEGE